MKTLSFYIAIAAIPFLFSCNQGTKSPGKDAVAKADSLKKSDCYQAIDGKDTADLKMKTLSTGKIAGSLVINYLDKGKNDGTFEGTFKGDTLFVDYTFKIGKSNPTVYKNPLALLKKDGKLILGVGQIVTTLGKSYFEKGKPISFESGRFVFAPVDCKN